VPDLPDIIADEKQLDELLSRPYDPTVRTVAQLDGDILILGAGGKIGPTVARMARRAVQAAGTKARVIAVDRTPLKDLGAEGIETIACDMLDLSAVRKLPRAKNIIFMVGRKFGSAGSESLTWAINVIVPCHVAATFTDSRIVAFSTGCVYPIVNVADGGCTEDTPPAPVGEYAMSCLGRERMFDHFSETAGEKVLQFRLNYAVELRYGVLVDVAGKVWRGEPVDVTTGYANVIWQGDAVNAVLRCLPLADRPPRVLNVTGPETLSIRQVATTFGKLLGRDVSIAGTENGRAYLADATRAQKLLGPPQVPAEKVIAWTAEWIRRGGASLNKPTHFETQNGKY